MNGVRVYLVFACLTNEKVCAIYLCLKVEMRSKTFLNSFQYVQNKKVMLFFNFFNNKLGSV